MKILDGLKVVDLSRILAGPWATQFLADLGADVIKVEKPESGDDTRFWGPPWWEEGEQRESAYFLCANRGKRSLTLDLKHPQAKDVIARLVREADVIVENFRPGQLDRFDIGPKVLRQENPRLVICSITGFGQHGPFAQRPGYDAMIQAMGGLMSITVEAGGPAQKVGVAAADLMTGMYAAAGILAAVLKARETGRGSHLDLALFDTQLAWLANQAMNALVTGTPPTRHGNAHPSIVPYQVFATLDGAVVLAIGNDGQFQRFCDAAGKQELASDPRFASNQARVENREACLAKISALMSTRTSAEWENLCAEAQVPCGPILDVRQALAHPQARARGQVRQFPQTSAPYVHNPFFVDGKPLDTPRPPPKIGEHTDAILKEAGLSPDQVRTLKQNGVA